MTVDRDLSLPDRTARDRALARPLSRRRAALALVAILLLMVVRAPILLLEPRLWGEDATVHLAYAVEHGWLATLLFVPVDHGPAGYVNLVPNLAALIATKVLELEWAAAVFTVFALVFQLLPFVVVLFGRSTLWKSGWEQIAAASLLLLTPAVTGEVWLNTVNTQVFCGILAVVLLCETTTGLGPLRRKAYRGSLAVAGLTGVYAVALAPVFLLRHRLRRDPESRVQAWILASAAAVQVTSVVVTYWLFDPPRSLLPAIDWERKVSALLYHQFLRPVLGDSIGRTLFGWIGLDVEATAGYLPLGDPSQAYLRLSAWISLGLIFGFLLWLRRRPLGDPLPTLLLALLVVQVFVLAAGRAVLPAGRYAVVGGAIVSLLLLLVALRSTEVIPRRVARVLVLIALGVGLVNYRADHPEGTLGDRLRGRPAWRDEVAAWRSQQSPGPAVWPPFSSSSAAGPGLRRRLLLRPVQGASAVPGRSRDLERDLQLVATDGWEVRSYPTEGLPPDFRLTFDVLASRAADEVELRLRLEDERGQVLLERPVTGFPAERSFRIRLDRAGEPDLLELDPSLVDVVSFAMRPRVRQPTRVKVLRLRVGWRVEGLLDPLLSRGPPALGSEPSHVAAPASGVGTPSSRGPRDGGEPTRVLERRSGDGTR